MMKQVLIEAGAQVMDTRVNLRADSRGTLRGVGLPSVTRKGTGAVNVVEGLVCRHGDRSESYFYLREGALWCANSLHGHREIAAMEDARCGVAVSDGVVLFCASGPRRFRYDGRGRWTALPQPADFAPFVIERRDAGSESVDVGDIKLTGSYDSRSHELSMADRAAIGDALDKAYRRLVDTAAASHRYIQPVVARYEITGHDGSVLYRSAPVMVSPDAGVQGVGCAVTVPAGTPGTLTGARLTATSFTLALVRAGGDDSIMEDFVADVRLTVSPQLHPSSPGLPSVCRYDGATSSAVAYTVYVPGYSYLVQPGAEGGLVRSRTLAVLSNINTALRPYAMPLRSYADDIKTLSSLNSKLSSLNLNSKLSSLNFTPRVAASNGDTIIYGGLTLIPFDGYAAAEMATGTEYSDEGMPTAVRVTMADGSGVVRGGTVSGVGLSRFSALLTYPSASARKMLVICGGARGEYDLEPTPDGAMSFRLAPDCRPLSLADSGAPFVLPAASAATVELPDTFAVAQASNSLCLMASGRSEAGPVTCVASAPRVAWGVAKPGFYVMGRGGIMAVAPASSLGSLTSSLIDPRGVTSATAAAVIPGGVAVVAGGELLSLSGTRATVLLDSCDAGTVAYSPSRRELWLVSSPMMTLAVGPGVVGTDVKVYQLDYGTVYSRTGITPSSAVTLGARMLIVDSSGNERDCSAESDTMLTLGVSGSVPFASEGWTRASLCLPAFGRDLAGSVAVTARQGDGARGTYTVATFDIDGDLDHPVASGLAVPHCHAVGIELSVSTFHPTSFVYDPR